MSTLQLHCKLLAALVSLNDFDCLTIPGNKWPIQQSWYVCACICENCLQISARKFIIFAAGRNIIANDSIKWKYTINKQSFPKLIQKKGKIVKL